MKPVLLDLFCRMGGATVGYQRAGFHVIGVDIEPQPGYPGDGFYQEDALVFLANLSRYLPGGLRPIMIHTSPPCQEGNSITNGTNKEREHSHKQLVPATRTILRDAGLPYVIEQPTSSRHGLIRRDVTLCMDFFKKYIGPPPYVFRHRSFEICGWTPPVTPRHMPHSGRVRGWRHGEYYPGDYIAAYGDGGGKGKVSEIQHAMGIDWMTDRFDLCEAIPPIYAQWLGQEFLKGVA